ncbi:MAG: serine/threonine-protein kinase, partial [Planctomycetota bacterium]
MTSSSRNEFKLIDDLCDEFEHALKRDALPSITTYLERAPQELRARLLRELCLLEAELLPSDLWSQRKREHLATFPADSSVIEAVQPPAAAPTPTGQADQTHADAPATRAATPVGQLVGAYALVELIGEGGMGSVFRAEQRQPVHREVALKLIRPGLDSREIRARFEAERQALAMMDHPNIARILEAGTTEDGQLYFAMEWVQGDPLVEYCDRKQMAIDERLALFTQVCEAVQHAHQKGVIHRDLKPSNILVAEFNGQPVPKVIDFGLAKALDASSQLTDRTLQTEFGQVIGTV